MREGWKIAQAYRHWDANHPGPPELRADAGAYPATPRQRLKVPYPPTEATGLAECGNGREAFEVLGQRGAVVSSFSALIFCYYLVGLS